MGQAVHVHGSKLFSSVIAPKKGKTWKEKARDSRMRRAGVGGREKCLMKSKMNAICDVALIKCDIFRTHHLQLYEPDE